MEWHSICKKCYDDIRDCSKDIAKVSKARISN